MSGTINYNIKCDTLVINNGSGDEKDREIARLKEENTRLTEENKLLKERHGYITDDTVSHSTTDNNIIHRVNGPLSHLYSIPSQPLTYRFQTNTNDLNDVSQDNGSPNIACDTDQTEPKLSYHTTLGTASRERPYDEVSPVYRDYPCLGDYKNVPSLLRQKTPNVTNEHTSNNDHKHDRAHGTKQNVNQRYSRMPNYTYLHPVHHQSVSLPPPLLERKQPNTIKQNYTNSGRDGPYCVDSTSNDESDDNIYQTISFPKQKRGTPKTARTQNHYSDNVTYQDVSFPIQESGQPNASRPKNRGTENLTYQAFSVTSQESGIPNAFRPTDNVIHQAFSVPSQESGTPNASRPQKCDNQPPKCYIKVVDPSYLSKSKPNVLNRDLANNMEKGENKIVKSKIYHV